MAKTNYNKERPKRLAVIVRPGTIKVPREEIITKPYLMKWSLKLIIIRKIRNAVCDMRNRTARFIQADEN